MATVKKVSWVAKKRIAKRNKILEGEEFIGNMGDSLIIEKGVIRLKEKGKSPNRIPYGEIGYEAVTWSEFKKRSPEILKLMKENRE